MELIAEARRMIAHAWDLLEQAQCGEIARHHPDKTQYAVVCELLQSEVEPLKVGEIAARTGLPIPSIRTVLYGNKSTFKPVRPPGSKRVRWSLVREASVVPG